MQPVCSHVTVLYTMTLVFRFRSEFKGWLKDSPELNFNVAVNSLTVAMLV